MILAITDVLVTCGGLNALMRIVGRRSETTTQRPRVSEVVGGARAALSTAKRYYIRRVWCLQNAAALSLLLRLRGIPAALVIGVRRYPFEAHAWIEVAGQVITSEPREVAAMYVVIARV